MTVNPSYSLASPRSNLLAHSRVASTVGSTLSGVEFLTTEPQTSPSVSYSIQGKAHSTEADGLNHKHNRARPVVSYGTHGGNA